MARAAPYYHTVGELAYQCRPAPSPYHQLPKLIAIIVIGICIQRQRTEVTVSLAGARPRCLSGHRRRLRPVHLVENKALSLLHPGSSLCARQSHPESEKARWRVGIANRKVFARPESFCAYIQNGPKIKSKHSISLESFWIVWKVSEQSGKFLDSLESFQTV